MWIWLILARRLKMLELFVVLNLIFLLFQWWVYSKRSFKNYVINNFKNKSKLFVFTYKFFALAYFEGAPGAGNLNAHAYKNIEIFGKKYMRITAYILFIGLAMAIFLMGSVILKYQNKITENLISDFNNNKISVTYSTGELTKIKWVKGEKYNIEISGDNDKNKFAIYKKIELKSNLKIGYFKEYNDKIVSITVDNKKIKTFNINEYKVHLKQSIAKSKTVFLLGVFSSLTMYFLLWIRYKKYGFKGVNKLIAIKKEEF